jgi:Xaa-Pro aminopeptidase
MPTGCARGAERAQRAAEAALEAMLDLLRHASAHEGRLALDGSVLTSETLQQLARAALRSHGAEAEATTVAHGAQAADPNCLGSGPLACGEPIVLDLYPRDTESGCHADLARTVIAGGASEELRAYHALCHQALDLVAALLKPGARGAELDGAGRALLEPNPFGASIRHPLGHGVGLCPHQPPLLGPGEDAIAAGDVIAVEAGLYRDGFGGCRLEDLFLVTEAGAERLTRAPYQLEL